MEHNVAVLPAGGRGWLFAQCQQPSTINVPLPISHTCSLCRTARHPNVLDWIKKEQKIQILIKVTALDALTLTSLKGLLSSTKGRDNSVGVVTRYCLEGPGIESLWWRNFRHPSRSVLPIPVVERSKARVCGLSFTGATRSNPAGGMDVCVVSVVRKRTKGKARTLRTTKYI